MSVIKVKRCDNCYHPILSKSQKELLALVERFKTIESRHVVLKYFTTIQSASNRLKFLYDAKLIDRERTLDNTGGYYFIYKAKVQHAKSV